MKPLAVFHHCRISGGEPEINFQWAVSILAEQIIAMRDSGLTEAASEITFGVNGDESDTDAVRSIAPDRAKVIQHPPDARGEHPTLRLMQQWCRENPGANVLYLHTKGATHKGDSLSTAWRRCMESVVIWNWQACVRALEAGYDAAGPHWVDSGCSAAPVPNYFAGNFFWATSNFIAALPLIAPTAVERLNFYDAEVLIARGPRPAKAMKFANHWPGARCVELMALR